MIMSTSSSSSVSAGLLIDTVTTDIAFADSSFETPTENMTAWYNTTVPATDYSQMFITEEGLERFSFISNGILSPVICLIGFVTNILGLGILWPDVKRKKLSVYIYLFALTVFDTVFLAIGLIQSIPALMEQLDANNASYVKAHMERYLIYVDVVISCASDAMIVVLSFERLISLVQPLHVKNTLLARFPFHIISICFVFNVIFLLPYMLNFGVVTLPAGGVNVYIYKIKDDVKDIHEIWQFFQFVITICLPVLILTATNTAIPIQYYRSHRKRLMTFNLKSDEVSNDQGKITATIFVITAMYILLIAPMFISRIMRYVDPEYNFGGKKRQMVIFAIDINNICSYINKANDTPIYILVSSRYYSAFKTMYCRCRQSRPDAGGIRRSPETIPQNRTLELFTTSQRQ